ncbi:UNC93-like protein MFSD11 [Glossina fuscipes]|uniref:UNC93-like protein MFSD11 n=1 Tax=Glossina fuscipes TaxID=7396 RepID=A0A9C6DUH1_9MUSC|nr:UNC93-like protein MFSD11 [Glossina fuscipes]
MDVKFLNIFLVGFGFMLLFTAFQTLANIEKTILESLKKDDASFTGDGYVSLSIIYLTFSLFNWLAPSFIASTSPRVAMVVGSLIYIFFMTTFLYPMTGLLYTASALLGFGAATLWTGQGALLARCSDSSNISRNSGIFWALLQCNMFFGNLFVYFAFRNKAHIDENTRLMVVIVLSAVGFAGVLFLIAVRRVPDNSEMGDTNANMSRSAWGNARYALQSAGKLFITRDMMLLTLTFVYTGLELSFFSGIYGPSVGFTEKIHETPKEYVGIIGICIGIGGVTAGTVFGILGSKTARFGRNPIVITAYVIHLVAFFLIYLNLPDNAPFKETEDVSYIDPPKIWLALLCALMLGLGDGSFNTQIYSMLAGVFVKQSAAAFAIFKFTQSVAAAIAFFYAYHLGLGVQLGILVIFATFGTITFCFVELKYKQLAISEKAEESGK